MGDDFRVDLKGLRGYGESLGASVLLVGAIALAIFGDLGPFAILLGVVVALMAFILAWIWLGSESLVVRDGKLLVERRLLGTAIGRDARYSRDSIAFITVHHESALAGAVSVSFDMPQRMGLFRGPVVLKLVSGETIRIGEGLTYDDDARTLQVARGIAGALGVEFRPTH